ncbi:MAG: hypothetical protein F6J93_25105 [Oscillatoria sp. SIO1A7]|nr:hypothetical protein [Oscillatoria sp. SIO1A7]
MEQARVQKLTFRASIGLCATSFLLVLAFWFSYLYEKNKTVQAAKKEAQQQAVSAAEEIDAELRKLSDRVDGIAKELTSGNLKDDQLLERLKNTIEQNTSFFTLGAAYTPGVERPTFDGEGTQIFSWYAPLYARDRGYLELIQVQDYYDYTEPKRKWYNRPLAEGSLWLEPFIGEFSKTLIAGYSAPFYNKNKEENKKEAAGVVYGSYSFEFIRNLIKSLSIGKTGYGFLLSKKGVFIYHPLDQFVDDKVSIFDRAKILKNPLIRETSEKALNGQSVVMDDISAVTGQETWLFFEPIASTGWALGVVYIKDEIFSSTESLKRKLIAISLALIAFLFFLSVIVFRAYLGRTWSLWAVSTTTSICLSAGIGFNWYLSLSERPDKITKDVIVLSESGLRSFLESGARVGKESKRDTIIYLPTGVFVQSVQFLDANNVFMTGYIWQKYTDGIHDDVSRGVILPESVTSNDFEMAETYRYKEGNVETIGWYFEAELRQNFDYTRYPFDAKDIRLRLWHQDLNKNMLLVPDLKSYELMNPTSLPGVEKDFVLPGWDVESSFFQYKINSYNTSFGINSPWGTNNVPELYFTIIAKRKFITVFISNVMPSLVLACLLFCLQIIISHKREKEALHFTALEIVSTSGAFIFIVILDQISLRSSIAAGGIIYIEFFYFILYIIILWVTVNAIILASGVQAPLIRYRNNILLKLFYWPVVLTLLLIVTLFSFV